MSDTIKPSAKTLAELQASGWRSRSVKEEIRSNFLKMLANGEPLYPGIIGYEDTVIPELNIALLAGHDLLFLGEKGQAKSRLMRTLVRFLDEYVPYLDILDVPVHEDPFHPITKPPKSFWQITPQNKCRSDGGTVPNAMSNALPRAPNSPM